MRANFEVVCGERNKIFVIWVEHNVPTKIYQLDEVLFPRFRPFIRTYAGYDDFTDFHGMFR